MGLELWIEEHDKAVWHLATQRVTPRSFRVVCGWRMTPTDTRIYPRKPGDPALPVEARCRSCDREPTAIPIDVPPRVTSEPD